MFVPTEHYLESPQVLECRILEMSHVVSDFSYKLNQINVGVIDYWFAYEYFNKHLLKVYQSIKI